MCGCVYVCVFVCECVYVCLCVRLCGLQGFLQGLQGLIVIITQLSLSVIIHQHNTEQNINKTDRLHILLLYFIIVK